MSPIGKWIDPAGLGQGLRKVELRQELWRGVPGLAISAVRADVCLCVCVLPFGSDPWTKKHPVVINSFQNQQGKIQHILKQMEVSVCLSACLSVCVSVPGYGVGSVFVWVCVCVCACVVRSAPSGCVREPKSDRALHFRRSQGSKGPQARTQNDSCNHLYHSARSPKLWQVDHWFPSCNILGNGFAKSRKAQNEDVADDRL